MKKVILLLGILCAFSSCNSQDNQESLENTSEESKPVNMDNYDKSFIEGLSAYTEPYTLQENYIKIEGEKYFFPEDLPLNESVEFISEEGENKYRLLLKRVNLTSLEYTFVKLINGKMKDPASGKATLNSMFFLGSESDEDEKTEESYLSTEYTDSKSDCSFSIRVGEKGDDNKLRVKISRYCENDKAKNIELDQIPTLRTK